MTVNAQWFAASESTSAQLSSGEAHWLADLDAAAGGSGQAPTPHQLLDSALAACTVLTLQLYSRRKQYPMQGVSVEVQHAESAGVYSIVRRIGLTGPLSTSQREDLLRVANACPIHKVLRGQFQVSTELVG